MTKSGRSFPFSITDGLPRKKVSIIAIGIMVSFLNRISHKVSTEAMYLGMSAAYPIYALHKWGAPIRLLDVLKVRLRGLRSQAG